MTRVEEFDAFYHDSRRQVLHQTYALTGDLAAAIVAVEDAYANAWQHWTRVRVDPLGQVRPEAMRVASLRRSAHLLRRKRREDTDTELLDALGALNSTARRLVLLQTAGGLDIAGAAREVGITADNAVETTDQAVTELEDRLNASTGQIERRLHDLRRITDAATLPRAATIRRSGTRRKHRNTLIAVAASAAVIAGTGIFVTAPMDGRAEDLHPDRAKIGRDASTTEAPIGASEDQLLSAPQVVHLDLKANWKVADTSSDLDTIEPFTACALARYGTPKLRQVWVRTFKGGTKKKSQYAIESIEVARSKAAARSSYRKQLNWYAGCQVPRIQLLNAYTVSRTGTDIRILVLRKWSDPIKTITVGVARSGFITSTFVHQVESRKGPSVSAFADILDDSLGLLCENTGGICQLDSDVKPVQPPVTGEGNGFLGAVDIPPIANMAKVLIGTPPKHYPAKQNPAKTSCDEAQFKGDGVKGVRSRSYVVLHAKQVPTTFGITETIATFPSDARAKNYLKRLEKRLGKCENRNLAASVRGPHRDGEGSVKIRTWWLSLEATSDKDIEYRMALVRNGSRVAQVMFTPVGRFDVSGRAFNALAIRAGQRLAELD